MASVSWIPGLIGAEATVVACLIAGFSACVLFVVVRSVLSCRTVRDEAKLRNSSFLSRLLCPRFSSRVTPLLAPSLSAKTTPHYAITFRSIQRSIVWPMMALISHRKHPTRPGDPHSLSAAAIKTASVTSAESLSSPQTAIGVSLPPAVEGLDVPKEKLTYFTIASGPLERQAERRANHAHIPVVGSKPPRQPRAGHASTGTGQHREITLAEQLDIEAKRNTTTTRNSRHSESRDSINSDAQGNGYGGGGPIESFLTAFNAKDQHTGGRGRLDSGLEPSKVRNLHPGVTTVGGETARMAAASVGANWGKTSARRRSDGNMSARSNVSGRTRTRSNASTSMP